MTKGVVKLDDTLKQFLTPQQREFKIQCAAVIHIRSAFPGLNFTAIPNRPGSATDGYFKKLMGVVPGASDLIFSCKGLIEIKDPYSGRVSRSQNMFLSSWARDGWKTAVCTSVRSVHEALRGWGCTPIHDSIIEPDLRTWNEKVQDAMEFFAP